MEDGLTYVIKQVLSFLKCKYMQPYSQNGEGFNGLQ